MQIQKLSSSKLFYNKWPYKIECWIRGSSRISRQGIALTKAFCRGDSNISMPYRSPYQPRSLYSSLDKNEKADLLKFVNAIEPFLKLTDQLQTRAESGTYNIFCKDLVLLETIHNALQPWIRRVVGPTTDEELDFMLDNGHKKILRDVLPHSEYQYKIYFKDPWHEDERRAFFEWTKLYPNNIIVTDSSRRWLEENRWAYNPFMYVKDPKTMTMVGLNISGHVRRVEEFILRENLITA